MLTDGIIALTGFSAPSWSRQRSRSPSFWRSQSRHIDKILLWTRRSVSYSYFFDYDYFFSSYFVFSLFSSFCSFFFYYVVFFSCFWFYFFSYFSFFPCFSSFSHLNFLWQHFQMSFHWNFSAHLFHVAVNISRLVNKFSGECKCNRNHYKHTQFWV